MPNCAPNSTPVPVGTRDSQGDTSPSAPPLPFPCAHPILLSLLLSRCCCCCCCSLSPVLAGAPNSPPPLLCVCPNPKPPVPSGLAPPDPGVPKLNPDEGAPNPVPPEAGVDAPNGLLPARQWRTGENDTSLSGQQCSVTAFENQAGGNRPVCGIKSQQKNKQCSEGLGCLLTGLSWGQKERLLSRFSPCCPGAFARFLGWLWVWFGGKT